MKINYLVLSALLISLLYALSFGTPNQISKAVICKSDLFKNNEEKRYSYIYSSAILGCKQKNDKEHYTYLPYFYNTSTGHLLCIAGLHIGSLTLFIFLSINIILYVFFPSFRKKGIPYFWFSLPIGIITSVLYVYFIGPEIPRLRAIIMLLFGSIALFIPVFKNKLLVLSITASIILFFLPDSIYSYSFYYSFIAVLGIFLSSTRKTIYMCVVIYLFLIPLNLHSSGTFDVNNILANSVVIPFFSFIYYPLNIILILLFVSGLHGVIYIMNLSTDVLLLLLRFFSHISDYTKIKTFNINTTEIIILYAVLILFFISIKYYKSFNRKKVIWFYSTVASIIVSTVLYLRYDHWNDKELINFELQKPKLFGGSGDIIFASTRSRNIVIDTGFGGFGSQKIIKEIKRKKIDNIDYLIITHSDADHAGGLADFLNEFYVRNVVISPSEYNYILQNGLIDKTNFIFACDGMSLDLDNTNTIKFIYPNCYYERKTKRKHNKKYHVRNKDRDKGLMWNKENNETVLSFIMTIGSYNFVISSDLPEKHLESILQKHKIESSNLIYQMPHHCNKKDNPPELLNSIKPILGFCTRDRKLLKKSILNPDEFDFPILMTGLCGDIGFRPENRGLEVFSQKCHKLSLQLKRT